jgi:hypothetical protein
MKSTITLIASLCVLTAGCSYSTMTESTLDSNTNKYTQKTYSKYYDAGGWILPDHLGASVVADHKKTRIPIAYGIQQSMGALGPSDSDAEGKITVYLWNFDDSEHVVTSVSLTSGRQTIKSTERTIAKAKERTGIVLGSIGIFDSGKEIPVTLTYQVDGINRVQKLTLLRRTKDELAGFYSPSGQLPYPWRSRVSELR